MSARDHHTTGHPPAQPLREGSNGHLDYKDFSTPAAATARQLSRWGVSVGKIQLEKKARDGKEWINQGGCSDAELNKAFERYNVGAALGNASPVYDPQDGAFLGYLADIDLDCTWTVRVADILHANHPVSFGRRSKGRSHLLVVVTDLTDKPPRKNYTHNNSGISLELRTHGEKKKDGSIPILHTVMPGSRYEEPIEWTPGHDAERLREVCMPLEQAEKMAGEIAAAALLARHAAGSEDYNNATIALISWLARAGWEQERIVTFVASVRDACGAASLTGGRDDRRRLEQLAADSLKRLEDDKAVTGFAKMVEFFGGEDVVKKAAEWLKLQTAKMLHPRRPEQWAEAVLSELYTQDGVRTLHWSQQDFFRWRAGAYERVSNDVVESEAFDVLRTYYLAGEKGPSPFPVTPSNMRDVVTTLRNLCNVDRYGVEPPMWLDGHGAGYEPEQMIAFKNGLLHLPSGEFLNPTPRFFTLNALDIDYQPNAPEPEQWLGFLSGWGQKSIWGPGDDWGGDEGCIKALQEWMGYLLTPDTTQQKIMLMVGPKRSGKGTIGRTIQAVVGHKNSANPTINALGERFGLQDLIGKTAATITDIRLSGRTDAASVAERLLSVSGEDSITIDRKYRDAWTGQLHTRFTLMTNEMPRIADASGALASRFIILPMERSFYDREDRGLWNRLKAELPGIVNWAIEGYRRLQERGHFVPPGSGKEAVKELEALSSPIKAFVEDHCEIDNTATAKVDDLYYNYQQWCHNEGRKLPATKQTFSRDLRAAYHNVTTTQRRENGRVVRVFSGIKLLAPVVAHNQGGSGGSNDPEF